MSGSVGLKSVESRGFTLVFKALFGFDMCATGAVHDHAAHLVARALGAEI